MMGIRSAEINKKVTLIPALLNSGQPSAPQFPIRYSKTNTHSSTPRCTIIWKTKSKTPRCGGKKYSFPFRYDVTNMELTTKAQSH